MDGVIVDSNPVHREAWEIYTRRFGIETTEEMQQRMYGKRNDQIIRDSMGDSLDRRRGVRAWCGLERTAVPGADRTEAGIVRQPGARPPRVPGSSSRTPDGSSHECGGRQREWFVLDAAGLAPFFRAVVDGHQVSNPKPAPDVFLKAAELLGAEPRDSIVFEDSYSGVQAGLAAGMRVVGLRTTHHELPGTSLAVDNFLAPELGTWMRDTITAIRTQRCD